MNPITVTNEDFSVEQTVARLKQLLESPPLVLAIKGGGVLLITRAEVEHVIWQFERIMRISREEPHLVPVG